MKHEIYLLGYVVVGCFNFVEKLSWAAVVKGKLSIEHSKQYDTQCPHVRWFAKIRLATEYIWRYVRRRTTLILQQIILAGEMLSETKVCYSHLKYINEIDIISDKRMMFRIMSTPYLSVVTI